MSGPDHDFLRGPATVENDEYLTFLYAMNRGIASSLSFFLNRVSGYHDLIDLELEDRPAGNIYLQESRIALAQSLDMLTVNDRMLASRQPQLEPIDLSVMMDGVVSRLKKVYQIDISLDLSQMADDEIFISGSWYLLQEVFFKLPRLLRTDAGAEPSFMAISGSLETFDPEFLKNMNSALEPGEYALISVGTGAKPAAMSQLIPLFERQVVADSGNTAEELIFTYGAIQAQHGDIFTVQSDHGLSVVSLALPLNRNGIAAYASTDVRANAILQGTETILVVDDEAIIWDVVINMLQKLGYTVILAANGKECIEIYRDNPGEIDLVLLDMVMPEMDGHDAFFELKALDPDVRVLLSSGYVKESDSRSVLDAGAIGFLQKPYRMIDLASKIRDIFGRP